MPAESTRPRPIRPYQPKTPAPLPESLHAPAPKPVDPSSRVFKQAAGKYVRAMVALPILLVTSWVLFDRLALGTKPKTFRNRPDEHGPEGSAA